MGCVATRFSLPPRNACKTHSFGLCDCCPCFRSHLNNFQTQFLLSFLIMVKTLLPAVLDQYPPTLTSLAPRPFPLMTVVMGLHPLPSPPQMPTPHHCGHPHCNNCHQCRLPSCHDHHHHCYVHRHGNLGVITTAADINTTVSRTSTAKVLRPITAVTPSLQRGTTRYHCSINYQRDKQHCICHRFLHKICMGTD